MSEYDDLIKRLEDWKRGECIYEGDFALALKHLKMAKRDYEVMYKLQQAGEKDIQILAKALKEAADWIEFYRHDDGDDEVKYSELAEKYLDQA